MMKTLPSLNLPQYDFIFNKIDGKDCIFDEIRRKYIAVTPEEWVRQNFIRYLVKEKKYPAGLIKTEAQIKTGIKVYRYDAAVFDRRGNPHILIEFKSPEVKISKETFRQISIYNKEILVKYLIVSNGLVHYCIEPDYVNKKTVFLEEIPDYE